jgi:DNA-binding beta-propeller fold protein YncE
MRRAWIVSACVVGAACTPAMPSPDAGTSSDAGPFAQAHSSSIVLSADGGSLYTVNADADSISELSVASRARVREIALGMPMLDAGTFVPSVLPRALALSPDGATLYASGERSGLLYEVALANGMVSRTVRVGSEPFGVVVSPSGDAVFVAVSQDRAVVRVDATTFRVIATAQVPAKPWALAWSQGALWVSHFLSGAVTRLEPSLSMPPVTSQIPDTASRGDRRLAHGQPRSLYDLAPRPGTDELWVAHALLGTDTAQPQLDFESTAFPTLTVLKNGAVVHSLTTDAPDVPGIDGAFADVVSGPRAVTFTRDGRYAFVADANSEDVLLIDAVQRTETALLRPLPGHQPEGLVLSADETQLFIEERNTADVAVVKVERSATGVLLNVDGAPIARLATDPMPATLRLGQHLFYSANSDEYPITKNHWVACATCHPEGRSDAVTWRFEQGPRDTPTNAGGTLGTGFLLRTADRTRVQDYWHTINTEQGGQFDATAQASLLDALEAYVDHGIPFAVPPSTDAAKVTLGRDVFNRPAVGCTMCHTGPRFTDSGSGNPTLDLAGPITLHDVGTCVTAGDFPDLAHQAVNGDPRSACNFDTPSLQGLWDSAPYLHDGSAATIKDVLEKTRGRMGDISSLTSDEEDALVEFLKSL